MADAKPSEKFYLERFGVTDRELLAAMGRVKVRDVDYQDLYPVIAPATEVATPEKVALLERIDRVARAYDPRIKNVMASFTTEYKTVLIANAEGELVGDVQPLSRLQVACIAEEHGQRQVGSFGGRRPPGDTLVLVR